MAALTRTARTRRIRFPRLARRGWRRRVLACAVLVAMLVATWCVVVARRPGNESFVAKGADWMRDHDLGGVANLVETAYYEHTAPARGGTPSRVIDPSAPAYVPAASVPTGLAPPPPVQSPASPPVPNEGVWVPVTTTPRGVAIAEAQLRPDATHTSVLGALMWMNPRLVRFTEVPGTVEPGGAWQVVGTLGGDARNQMVAAFNGGFRFKDSAGGFYAEGREAKPLVDGAASLVVRADGTADVAQWGRDATLGPQIDAVRQNLVLIVDNGQPTAGLDTASTSRWGRGIGNRVLVWRSGVGVRPDGSLVYAASNGITVSVLADMLVRAGCVRAMELDINPEWVTFNLFTHPDATQPDAIAGQKALPDMTRAADRYLGPDSRDFTAVLLR